MVLGIEYTELANLLLHKQLVFKKGKIILLDEGVTFVPLSTHIAEIKFFESKNLCAGLYLGAKFTGVTWNKKMLKTYSSKTPREIFEWGNKVLNLAGYGEFSVHQENTEKNEFIWRLYDSQIANAFVNEYGKVNFPVCHRPRGYFAGAASFVSGKDLDAVETKCLAKGDTVCEFVIKAKNKFNKNDKLTKRQLLF